MDFCKAAASVKPPAPVPRRIDLAEILTPDELEHVHDQLHDPTPEEPITVTLDDGRQLRIHLTLTTHTDGEQVTEARQRVTANLDALIEKVQLVDAGGAVLIDDVGSLPDPDTLA